MLLELRADQRAARPRAEMPSSAAIAAAVTGWSPVIMIGRTPARRASATAARASGRGGSIIPTTPSQTSVCSTSSESSPVSASRSSVAVGDADACAAPRSPAGPRSREISSRRAGVSGRVPPPTRSSVQRESRTSGAPFAKTSTRPVVLGVRVGGAHELALRRERHLADAREALVEPLRRPAPPCARRPAARPRSGRPGSSSARPAGPAPRCSRGPPPRAPSRPPPAAKGRSTGLPSCCTSPDGS